MPAVSVETSEGICTLTISRPEALNALNRSLLSDLNSAVDSIPKDAGALIVTGAGKAFVAGADISEMANIAPKEAEEFAKFGQGVFSKIANLNIPVIAAVNGYALGGGCELALACDIRIASDRAKFGQPETGLGITPGFGATQRLPSIVGAAKAKELIFTGAVIDANEAFRIGLANKVVPAEKLMEEARLTAKAILEKGPIAISKSKQAIGAYARPENGFEIEAKLFGECFGPEQKEGMKAFLEKRKPCFKRQ